MKPKHFELNEILADFLKLGKLVIFVDNSYTTNDKNENTYPTFDEGIFKIIDCGKAFPTKRSNFSGSCHPINNIKVRNIYTGVEYYCSNLNLRSIEHGKALGPNLDFCVKYKGIIRPIKEVFCSFPPHW